MAEAKEEEAAGQDVKQGELTEENVDALFAHRNVKVAKPGEGDEDNAKDNDDDDDALSEVSVGRMVELMFNADGRYALWQRFKRKVGGARKNMKTLVANYGPPYHADYGGDILEEINKPYPSVLDIHSFLHNGCDPNVVDKNDLSNSALMYAARKWLPLVCKMCLQAHADLNYENVFQQTALLFACMQSPIVEAQELAQAEVVKMLLDAGANLHPIDKTGRTALDYAAEKNNIVVVLLLLEAGAPVRKTRIRSALPARNTHEYTTDPIVRRLLLKHLEVENAAADMREAEREEDRKIEEHMRKRLRREKLKEIARIKREREDRRRTMLEKYEHIEKMRSERLNAEIRKRQEMMHEKFRQQGRWVPYKDGLWHWESIPSEWVPSHVSMLSESRSMLRDIRHSKKPQTANTRWRALTGTDLEAAQGPNSLLLLHFQELYGESDDEDESDEDGDDGLEYSSDDDDDERNGGVNGDQSGDDAGAGGSRGHTRTASSAANSQTATIEAGRPGTASSDRQADLEVGGFLTGVSVPAPPPGTKDQFDDGRPGSHLSGNDSDRPGSRAAAGSLSASAESPAPQRPPSAGSAEQSEGNDSGNQDAQARLQSKMKEAKAKAKRAEKRQQRLERHREFERRQKEYAEMNPDEVKLVSEYPLSDQEDDFEPGSVRPNTEDAVLRKVRERHKRGQDDLSKQALPPGMEDVFDFDDDLDDLETNVFLGRPAREREIWQTPIRHLTASRAGGTRSKAATEAASAVVQRFRHEDNPDSVVQLFHKN